MLLCFSLHHSLVPQCSKDKKINKLLQHAERAFVIWVLPTLEALYLEIQFIVVQFNCTVLILPQIHSGI